MTGSVLTGWIYYGPTNEIEKYDATGHLQSLQFADSLAVTLTYSDGTASGPTGDVAVDNGSALPAGLLLRVVDGFGRTLKLGYLASTQLASVTDTAARKVSFGFDTVGRLKTATYPDATAKTYVYHDEELAPLVLADSSMLLTGIRDENGARHSTFSYDSSGKAVATELAGGVNKFSVIYPTEYGAGGAAKILIFDPNNGSNRAYWIGTVNGIVRHTADTQASGGINALYGYDPNGFQVRFDDLRGYRTCYAYDPVSRLRTVQIEGLLTSANCDALTPVGAALPVGSRKVSTAWHPFLQLKTRVAEPGKITVKVYNGQGDPSNGGAILNCVPAGTPLLNDGNPLAVLCKQIEQSTSDVDGHLGFSAIAQAGVPVRVQQWTYNASGQVRSVQDPRNNVTTYAYYGDTNADHTLGDLQVVQDALTHLATFNRYNPYGQVLQSTDANSVATTYTYDPRRRLKSRTVAAGTAQARTTAYTYFPTGLLQRVDLPAGVVGTSAGAAGALQGRSITYGYDDAHRLVQITTSSGEEIDYGLDNAGNVIREEVKNSIAVSGSASLVRRDFDFEGRLFHEIQIINGVDQTTTYGHDANGNSTTTQWPLVAAYGESANPKEVRRYNALNQLTQIEDAANGSVKPTVLTVDPRDLVTSVSVPNNATTGFSLDGFGQTLTGTSPDRGTTSITYDAAGNLKTRLDARGVTATWSYDALNRPLSVAFTKSGSTDSSDDQSYTWDTNPGGPIACANGVGRLCRLTDGGGTSHYAYDAFGNVAQMRRVEGGLTTSQSFGYDGEDRLSALTTASNRALALVRDSEGRTGQVLGIVAGAVSQIVKSTDYRADGQAVKTGLGNDVLLSRDFDTSGLVRDLTETLPSDPPPPPPPTKVVPTVPEWGMIIFAVLLMLLVIRRTRSGTLRMAPEAVFLAALIVLLARQAHADETLIPDARGNVQSRTVDGQASGYTYDRLNRLKSETGKATQTFGLDPNGNRTSDGTASYTVLANGNRLVTRNGVSLTYDAAGNLLSDQAKLNGATVNRSFTYSPAGRLRTVSINGALVATYRYDGSGMRTQKVLASPPANTPATTLYRYDTNGRLSEEISGSGANAGQTLVTYVWKDDVPSAVIYAPGTPSNSGAQERIVYLHTDHLNSPRKASDAQGKTVWSWTSDAFGSSAPNENVAVSGEKTIVNLRLPGQYLDAESGLYYNGQRYYDPQNGRYVQSDPIGMQGGSNTYAYAHLDPLRHIDPSGLAYFAYRPLQPLFPLLLLSPLLGDLRLQIAHEQLFFEDGRSPSDLGFSRAGVTPDNFPFGYRRIDGGYDDCIMRLAVAMNMWPGEAYGLICNNCQAWGAAVRATYQMLQNNPAAQNICSQECKP